MQYGQRKLHRSVTEMRMSRSGRPKLSPSWLSEGAVIDDGEARGRGRTGPPYTRWSLCTYCNRRTLCWTPATGPGRPYTCRHAALRIHPPGSARTCPHGGRHPQRGDAPTGRCPVQGPDEDGDGVHDRLGGDYEG